jgi:uncharacterized protein (DUF1697 family)
MGALQRYTAFLRAINVGGHTVKMDHLRSLFEALRFRDVSTFIASGNVIFHSPSVDTRKLEQQIERHLEKALGYEVGTFLRSSPELEAISRYEPFAGTGWEQQGHTLYVLFMHEPATASARRRVTDLTTEDDTLHVNGREIYWLRRTSMRESPVSGALLEKLSGVPLTARNINTVNRIVAKYSPL